MILRVKEFQQHVLEIPISSLHFWFQISCLFPTALPFNLSIFYPQYIFFQLLFFYYRPILHAKSIRAWDHPSKPRVRSQQFFNSLRRPGPSGPNNSSTPSCGVPPPRHVGRMDLRVSRLVTRSGGCWMFRVPIPFRKE